MPFRLPPLRRFSRPAIYTAAGATTGYIVYRTYNKRSVIPNAASLQHHTAPKPPQFPPLPTRAEQITRLRSGGNNDGAEYDLVVIGGGATGCGVALDAASRGLKVALIERDDFASGTSSKSTKLVHGGVRYLEKAVRELDYDQYLLVKEALKERAVFLETAPHLSMALPIMLPIYKWWQAPYYWVGTKCYDFLAGKENLESSYFLTKSKAREAFPMLKEEGLVGSLVYYDGAHNDSRMNVALALTAALYGATVVNHMEVTKLEKDAHGKITSVKAKDMIANAPHHKPFWGWGWWGNPPSAPEEITIKTKGVINATGPFTDSIRKLDEPSTNEIVAPSSGVHIVLPGYYSPQRMGLIDPSTSDGRVIFFLPWQGNTIAGTTDAPTEITPHPLPKEEEIEWILSEVRRYLSPDINVRRGDVLAAWSGIRPLVRDPNAKNTESLVRNHLINVSPSGLITIAGGKWTTYRQMAEETVDRAISEFSLQPGPRHVAGLHPTTSASPGTTDGASSPDASDSTALTRVAAKIPGVIDIDGTCKTDELKLVGAHGYSKTLFIQLIQHYGVETSVAQHLADAYGDRAWAVCALSAPTHVRFPVRGVRLSQLYPFVDGEVRYAVRHEYAQTCVDVLARRTRLAFLNAQAALEALPRVLDIMGEELHWSRERREREWTQTVAFLVSMGLPRSREKVSREDVESGRAGRWESEGERRAYSRHDGPTDSGDVADKVEGGK